MTVTIHKMTPCSDFAPDLEQLLREGQERFQPVAPTWFEWLKLIASRLFH